MHSALQFLSNIQEFFKLYIAYSFLETSLGYLSLTSPLTQAYCSGSYVQLVVSIGVCIYCTPINNVQFIMRLAFSKVTYFQSNISNSKLQPQLIEYILFIPQPVPSQANTIICSRLLLDHENDDEVRQPNSQYGSQHLSALQSNKVQFLPATVKYCKLFFFIMCTGIQCTALLIAKLNFTI